MGATGATEFSGLAMHIADAFDLLQRQAVLRARMEAGEALNLIDAIDAMDGFSGPAWRLQENLLDRGIDWNMAAVVADEFFDSLCTPEVVQ